ncbi:heavy metal translocating P-type ATPase [Nafulsella turpanensis]|uniref:heavy metal translocating P-type ATPase n=1 Tax=Nafulsella turpanensis TaxID=1265690 RepID=UPI00034609B3|nr:heavy metal translocating P-type ATPase metal-binding domain-containing protein [Nafulsella turpanensis]
MSKILEKQSCYHCGEDCPETPIIADQHSFCCQGCHTVYDILKGNDLAGYYEMEKAPGSKRGEENAEKWAFLELEEIRKSLIQFTDGRISKTTFYIPAIHCSSCIWLLENLNRLDGNVYSSTVNFLKKEVSLSWSEKGLSLRQLAELLSRLGYAPDIKLESGKEKKKNTSRSFYIQLGVAGFCFGNIMMLSLPEYLDSKSLVEESYKQFFAYLNMLLVLPVVLYSAKDFYISAWRGIRYKYLSLDLTISLGILTIFGRSLYEMLSQTGAGYMDSLAGLVFFLLIGKWYQSKTYEALSFERDYNSYFPLAATRIKEGKEETVLLKELQTGDRILVRNQELIPADSILLKGEGKIDYAFVTGESEPVNKQSGDFLYAGGRQIGGMLEVSIQKPVESSYLTQLWNQEVFRKGNKFQLSAMVQGLSKRFTWFILILSLATLAFWFFVDPGKMWNALTAVLIVACPCALALVIPFALGNTLRVLGRWGLYLKNAEAVEALANIDTLVFDKTGTITHKSKGSLQFTGTTDYNMLLAVRSLTRNSTHPLSQSIYASLGEMVPVLAVEDFKEEAGAGLSGKVNGQEYRLGSAAFTGTHVEAADRGATRVYVSRDGQSLGFYQFNSQYREGLADLQAELREHQYQLHLLSGDNDRERTKLQPLFDELHFNQQPMGKLSYIRKLKEKGRKVLMIGDGLNDAGALQESNVGISVSDDIYHFSPACDAILDAKSFDKILKSMQLAKGSRKIINIAFLLSFLYNIIGLSFAVSAQLSPIVCAILMPLSSVTIVGFVTLGVQLMARKLEKQKYSRAEVAAGSVPAMNKAA